jgi:hypothetical protein
MEQQEKKCDWCREKLKTRYAHCQQCGDLFSLCYKCLVSGEVEHQHTKILTGVERGVSTTPDLIVTVGKK